MERREDPAVEATATRPERVRSTVSLAPATFLRGIHRGLLVQDSHKVAAQRAGSADVTVEQTGARSRRGPWSAGLGRGCRAVPR